MSTVAIFILGVIVSGITGIGAILVGLAEAADPEHSRPEDLTEIEQEIVNRSDTSPNG